MKRISVLDQDEPETPFRLRPNRRGDWEIRCYVCGRHEATVADIGHGQAVIETGQKPLAHITTPGLLRPL